MLLLVGIPQLLLGWLERWLLGLLLLWLLGLLLWWLWLLSPHVSKPPDEGKALKLKVFLEVIWDVLELVPEEVLEACPPVCGILHRFLLDLGEGGIE